VGNIDDGTRAKDHPGDARLRGKTHLPHSGGDSAVQLAALLVVEEDAGALAVEDLQRGFLDDLEERLQIRRGRELARDFENSKEVAVLAIREVDHRVLPAASAGKSLGSRLRISTASGNSKRILPVDDLQTRRTG